MKIYNGYTQKIKKESKHNTRVSHEITREENKGGREEKRPIKNTSKTMNKMAIRKYIPIIVLKRLSAPTKRDRLT